MRPEIGVEVPKHWPGWVAHKQVGLSWYINVMNWRFGDVSWNYYCTHNGLSNPVQWIILLEMSTTSTLFTSHIRNPEMIMHVNLSIQWTLMLRNVLLTAEVVNWDRGSSWLFSIRIHRINGLSKERRCDWSNAVHRLGSGEESGKPSHIKTTSQLESLRSSRLFAPILVNHMTINLDLVTSEWVIELQIVYLSRKRLDHRVGDNGPFRLCSKNDTKLLSTFK